jgi:hypothetical protein
MLLLQGDNDEEVEEHPVMTTNNTSERQDHHVHDHNRDEFHDSNNTFMPNKNNDDGPSPSPPRLWQEPDVPFLQSAFQRLSATGIGILFWTRWFVRLALLDRIVKSSTHT